MKISEIIIKGFYGKNLNIKINNDLLILVGENESGKTIVRSRLSDKIINKKDPKFIGV